jgi:hypothetical protein
LLTRPSHSHLVKVAGAATVAAANGADALAGGDAAGVNIPVAIGLLLDLPVVSPADTARGKGGPPGLDVGADVAAGGAEPGAAAGRAGVLGAVSGGLRAALGAPICRARADGAAGIGGRAGRGRGAVTARAAVGAVDDRVRGGRLGCQLDAALDDADLDARREGDVAGAAGHQQEVLAAAATIAVEEDDGAAVVEVDLELAVLGAVRKLLAELAAGEGRGGLVAPAASLGNVLVGFRGKSQG